MYRVAKVTNSCFKQCNLPTNPEHVNNSQGSRLGLTWSNSEVNSSEATGINNSGYLYGKVNNRSRIERQQIEQAAKQAFDVLTQYDGGGVGRFAHCAKLVVFVFCPILLLGRSIADAYASKGGGSSSSFRRNHNIYKNVEIFCDKLKNGTDAVNNLKNIRSYAEFTGNPQKIIVKQESQTNSCADASQSKKNREIDAKLIFETTEMKIWLTENGIVGTPKKLFGGLRKGRELYNIDSNIHFDDFLLFYNELGELIKNRKTDTTSANNKNSSSIHSNKSDGEGENKSHESNHSSSSSTTSTTSNDSSHVNSNSDQSDKESEDEPNKSTHSSSSSTTSTMSNNSSHVNSNSNQSDEENEDEFMENELDYLLEKHKCSTYPEKDEIEFITSYGKEYIYINEFLENGKSESSDAWEVISKKDYDRNPELLCIDITRTDEYGNTEQARVYMDKKYKYNMGMKIKSSKIDQRYVLLGDPKNPGTSGAAYRMGRIIKKVENNLKPFLKKNNADVLKFSKHSMHLYRKAKILGIDRYIDMQVVYGNDRPNGVYKHGDANSVKLIGRLILGRFNSLDKVFKPNSPEFRKMLLVTLIGIAAGFSMRDNKPHGNWVNGERTDPTYITLNKVIRDFSGGDRSSELAVPGVPQEDDVITQIHSDFINTLETELEQIPEHERGTVIGGFMGLAGMIYSALFDQRTRNEHVKLQNNNNSDALEQDLYNNLLSVCELPECLTGKLPDFAKRLAKFVVDYKFGQNPKDVARFINDVRKVCNIESDFIPKSLEFLKTLEPPL